MDGAAASESAATGPVSPGTQPTLQRLIVSFADASEARVRLFEAESRRAAWACAYMTALAIAAALLLVTAWLILAACTVYAAGKLGMPWWLGAAVVVAAHVGFAFLLIQQAQTQVDRLSFAATLQSLRRVLRGGASE